MKNHRQGGNTLRASHINCTRRDSPKICCQTTLEPFLGRYEAASVQSEDRNSGNSQQFRRLYKTEEGAKVPQDLYNIHGSFEVIVREYLVVRKNIFYCTHLHWHLASKAKQVKQQVHDLDQNLLTARMHSAMIVCRSLLKMAEVLRLLMII